MSSLDQAYERALAAAKAATLTKIMGDARKHGVSHVEIMETMVPYRGGGNLRVTLGNGEVLTTGFGSFTILKNHVRKWRSAYGAGLMVNGSNEGKVANMNPALMREGEAAHRATKAATPRTRSTGVDIHDHKKLWPWFTRMGFGPKFGTGISIAGYQMDMASQQDKLIAAAKEVTTNPKYVRAQGTSVQAMGDDGRWHDVPRWQIWRRK